MRISVITLFPGVFEAYMSEGIVGRAVDRGIVRVELINPRDFATDRHRTVDDYPYGGGPGMVLKPEPLAAAIESARGGGGPGEDTRTILLSPQGRRFDQALAAELAGEERRIVLVSGRYEGVDERVRLSLADEEISAGDYVLTGGELPALVIIDAVVRLLPGALGDGCSAEEESFSWGLLDYPHYTRPPEWRGLRVPEVLASGNHAEIARWRRREALRATMKRRPDLLEGANLTDEDRKMISDMETEEE